MNKRSIYTYIAASLAFLVPFPGRFVYGVVLVLELVFLMLIGTSFSLFIKKFELEELETPLYLIVLISATIFFRQIFILTQTEIALVLGFDFYLPAASAFLTGYAHNKSEEKFYVKIKNNMKSVLNFSLFALCFFLFRDIAGYGTFTFFGTNHRIYEKVIFDPARISIASFFATIPGALILCACILCAYISINRKFRIVHRANFAKKENSK